MPLGFSHSQYRPGGHTQEYRERAVQMLGVLLAAQQALLGAGLPEEGLSIKCDTCCAKLSWAELLIVT